MGTWNLPFSFSPTHHASPCSSSAAAYYDSFCNRLVQETQMNLCYAAKGDDMLECFRLAVGGFDVAAANYDGRTPMVR
ncbi:unnamed protein product [Closterium sp. NIES-53]